MGGLTLVDEYLLVACLLETGQPVPLTSGLDHGLGAAALLELCTAGRLSIRPDAVGIVEDQPTGDPALDVALRQLCAVDRLEHPGYWLDRLRGSVREAALTKLVDRGVLAASAGRIGRARSYRVVQPGIRREIVDRLTLALVVDSFAATDTTMLVALLAASGIPPGSIVKTAARAEWPHLPSDRTQALVAGALRTCVERAMLSAWPT